MLHGEVKINDYALATWQAERVGPAEKEPGVFVYRCQVDYRDQQGYPQKTGPFLVYHYPDAGPIVLAGLVMERAAYLFKVMKSQRFSG